MANVRCPMCSKVNPPEAEVCSFCGARLKPLRVAPSQPPAAGSSKSDEPDWLSQLRTDSPGAKAPEDALDKSPAAPGEDADVPDWLSRIRDRARTETSSSSDLFGEDKEEDADWMKGMQGDATADQGLNDWLSRLPGEETAQPSQVTPPAPAQPPANVVPDGGAFGAGLEPADWLRNLSNEGPGETQASTGETTGADSGASTGAEASEEDWMSKLSAWQADIKEEPGSSAVQPAAPGAEDEFGWLAGLSQENEAPAAQPDQGISTGTGMTDFLANLKKSAIEEPPVSEEPPAVLPEEGGLEWAAPETKPAHEEPASGFGLTGFLSQLEEPNAQTEPAPPVGDMSEDIFTAWNPPAEAAPGASEEIPSWLSGGPASAPVEPASQTGEPGVPDWLQGFGNEPAAQEMPAAKDMPAAAEPSAESGVPVWLQGTDTEAPSVTAAPFEAGESGLPAWLSGDVETPSQPEEQPFTLPQEQPQAGKSDLPSWLFADEASREPAPEAVEPDAQLPVAASGMEESLPAATDMPSWLSGEFAPAGESAAEEEPPAAVSAGAEAGLPDWFASFDQSEIEKTQPSRVTGGLKPASGQLPAIPPSAQEPPQSAEPAQEAEGPDWLRDFESQKEETGATISPLLSSAQALDSAAREGDQPFTVDLPEWLGEEGAAQEAEGQAAEPFEQSAEPAAGQLEQAVLPEWVREMRPLESILPGDMPVGEIDQRVEKAGPLAGMRGVLPVEDMASRYRKPPIYSIKLHVSEKQRNQASLLESILSQESQSLLIPPERALGTGVLMRVLLAAFLLIALAFPVVFTVGMLAEPEPARFPAENQMFEKISANLQSKSNAPVLLAIEYEPGLSGEMRMAANAVVEQLVEKKVRIVLISTVPAGPALGQQLLDDVSKDYSPRVNLGYLPGGTISLVNFAQQPKLAAPATLEDQPAWGANAILKDVNGLSDFSQVIVVTDRAEAGRAWVEQVQPQLGNVPLLVVASAQAAPLLQPYVDSGQIAGMTSGMLGGAMYAKIAGQENNRALIYLSAYQVGVVLAFAIVLVGGLVSGIMALVKRSNKEEE